MPDARGPDPTGPVAAVMLLGGAAAALVWANAYAGSYATVWSHRFVLGSAGWGVALDARHWINDGAMSVFFFVIGLEVKRALTVGELRHPRAAALPVGAALGGAAVPALVFLAVTAASSPPAGTLRGWGIPMATDPAFALGLLALARRAGPGVRVFLLTLATADDVASVCVIAVAYTDRLAWAWGIAAGLSLLAAVALRCARVTRIWPYLPLAAATWLCTLHSGVQATIAGVALGLLTPTRPARGRDGAAGTLLLRRLTPLSAFVIVPVFALANTGVPLSAAAVGDAMKSPITLGVAVALLAGKMVGIVGTSQLLRRLRIGRLPDAMVPAQLWGVGALGALGFTIAIFITDLAYADPHQVNAAKIGILAGSAAGGALGAVLLNRLPTGRPAPAQPGSCGNFPTNG